MGSKARIAKHILPLMLKNRQPYQYYIEPMCGGCNLIDKVDGNRIANDINPYLIAMFRSLQVGWVPPTPIGRAYYNEVRRSYNNKERLYPDNEIGYVGFIASYNGRFFDGGYSGQVITKNGSLRDYIAESRENIMKQIPLLKDVVFSCCDYKDMIISERSIIYYDPPYNGVKKYSYSINHSEFWEHCRKQVSEGHRVFISEYSAPEDFVCIWSGEIKTPINQTITKIAVERLFVHESQLN